MNDNTKPAQADSVETLVEELRRASEHTRSTSRGGMEYEAQLMRRAADALSTAPQAAGPVAWRDAVGNLYPDKESVDKYLPRGRTVEGLYTAPPAASDARDAERWRHIEPMLRVDWYQDESLTTWTWVCIDRACINVPPSTQYQNAADAIDAAMQQEGRSDGR